MFGERNVCACVHMFVSLYILFLPMVQNSFRQAIWRSTLKCLHDSGNFLKNTVGGQGDRLSG